MAAVVVRRTGAELRDKIEGFDASAPEPELVPAPIPKLPEIEQKAQSVPKTEAQDPTKFSYATADTLPLVDRFIDEPRPLKVAVIGGGLTGILAGVLLPAKVPGIKITIYEKNHDFGGTWLENVYPGVRCDIPSHVYQSTFAPKKAWCDEFAWGADICEYWQTLARNHDVYKLARFNERVTSTEWDSAKAKWIVSSTATPKDEAEKHQQEEYDFVLTAIGRFNDWKLPSYPGIETYTGHLRHTSNWDPSFDPAGKKVAVIGNGASGIQVVANLQKVVSRLDHYARSKTWIASSWAGDDRTLEAQPISHERLYAFHKDEAVYLKFRKTLEDKYWRRFDTFIKGTENNAVLRAKFTDIMQKRLGDKKADLAKDMIPDWSPNCRRLTPGPGYLEAIGEDNVDYIRTKIRRFTPTGIETEDGVHREVDAVLCATGSNSNMVPAFRISANGQTLEDVWTEQGFPYTYLGVAVPKFPNLLFVQGPHGTAPSGTVPQSVESQLAHFAKLLRKVSREGIKSIVPSQAAADDFVAYCDAFFKQSVVSESCSSWYNGGQPGARVHGIWPGSAVHLTMVRREPRWEDWEYEHLEESRGNRFLWYFGNGGTKKEGNLDQDVTEYLQGGEQDLRDVHESWWRVP